MHQFHHRNATLWKLREGRAQKDMDRLCQERLTNMQPGYGRPAGQGCMEECHQTLPNVANAPDSGTTAAP